MGSITGLNTGVFTSIDNSGEIRLGANIDPGTAGQVIVSAGVDEPAIWGTNSALLPNALTMGTNVSLASGNASFDGSVADTLNAVGGSTVTGGNGIDITGTAISTDNDNQTINNSGGTGAQNQVLKVPNVLTASTNIIFTNTVDGAAETTYDGSQPITIRAIDTNTEYTAGTNLNNGGTTFNLDTNITGQTGITFLNNGASTNLTGS